MLVLKRYADALRDGDTIYAAIRGTGLSNDGAGKHLLVPNPKGQRLAYGTCLCRGGRRTGERWIRGMPRDRHADRRHHRAERHGSVLRRSRAADRLGQVELRAPAHGSRHGGGDQNGVEYGPRRDPADDQRGPAAFIAKRRLRRAHACARANCLACRGRAQARRGKWLRLRRNECPPDRGTWAGPAARRNS